MPASRAAGRAERRKASLCRSENQQPSAAATALQRRSPPWPAPPVWPSGRWVPLYAALVTSWQVLARYLAATPISWLVYQVLGVGMAIATSPFADADDDFGPGSLGLFIGAAILGFLGTSTAFVSALIAESVLRGRWRSVRMRTIVSVAVAASVCGLLAIPLAGAGSPGLLVALVLLAAVTPGWAVVVPGALLVSQRFEANRTDRGGVGHRPAPASSSQS